MKVSARTLAADILALVKAVDHPRVRMMLDLYHALIGEGNLIELVRRAGPLIAEIRIRHPGRGVRLDHAPPVKDARAALAIARAAIRSVETGAPVRIADIDDATA